MTITGPLANPQLTDLMNLVREEIFASLNCMKIGKIQSFDTAKRTASIQIMFKRTAGDKIISHPVLVDCPIFTLQGGGGAVYMPIAAGDPCLVLFADRSIDDWYSSGSESAPTSPRCHDLSDGIAFVGINSLAGPLTAFPDAGAGIAYAGARLGLLGGKANIQNASKDLLTVLTSLVNGIQGLTCASPGSPVVDATGKVAAALTDLAALLYKD